MPIVVPGLTGFGLGVKGGDCSFSSDWVSGRKTVSVSVIGDEFEDAAASSCDELTGGIELWCE